MKKLFELGNQYVKESDWKDIALIKFCLFSMGVLFGMQTEPKDKKATAVVAAAVFAATYVPLMTKLFCIAFRGRGDDEC